MATEQLYKFDPSRTMQLVQAGLAGNATACISAATRTGCTVSGTALDRQDGAQLELWNADDYYGHQFIDRWLPHFDLTGVVLQFDFTGSNLQPLESPKYPWNDWPNLEVVAANSNVTTTVKLIDHATLQAGTLSNASGDVTINATAPLQMGDRMILRYANLAFDYTVPQISCGFYYMKLGAGYVHSVTIAGIQHSYTEVASDTQLTVAANVASAASGDSNAYVTATGEGNIAVTPKLDTGALVICGASDWAGPGQFYQVQLSTVARELVHQINTADYSALSMGLTAITTTTTSTSATMHITASAGGYDGNMLTVYTTPKTGGNMTARANAGMKLSGGNSDVTWRIVLDFSALGFTSVRKLLLTFAPRTADSTAFSKLEWSATIANIIVTDPLGNTRLNVADRNQSVTIHGDDVWVARSGSWNRVQNNNAYRGYVWESFSTGNSMTIQYTCQYAHELWIGTALNVTGTWSIQVDGDALTTVDCSIGEMLSRRQVRPSVTAGTHTVTLTHSAGSQVDLDFLQAVVRGDVLDPVATTLVTGFSTDFDTFHTVSLAPSRQIAKIQRTGLLGEINLFGGILYLFDRARVGDTYGYVTVTFGGTWHVADGIIISLGGSGIGLYVLGYESLSQIASHFAFFINETFTAVWAHASGASVTIAIRSPADVTSWSISPPTSTGTISTVEGIVDGTGAAVGGTTSGAMSGTLGPGSYGVYQIDPASPVTFARAARDWFQSYFACVAAAGLTTVVSLSPDLTNPPEGVGGQVWKSRYLDGTAGDFAVVVGLNGSHCTFSEDVLAYRKIAYKILADWMHSAGLTPTLQFGEDIWWYDQGATPTQGMAFYDSYTTWQATLVLPGGRALHHFITTNDDPSVNGYADANFLRSQLQWFVTQMASYIKGFYPAAVLEWLWARDVCKDSQQLNKYINSPPAFQVNSATLDRLKIEALSFGAYGYNLDAATEAINFAFTEWAWPLGLVKYNLPIMNGNCAWPAEFLAAIASGVAGINLWAFDHFFMRSEPLPLPVPATAVTT